MRSIERHDKHTDPARRPGHARRWVADGTGELRMLAVLSMFVAVVVVATYRPALHAAALCFDDREYLHENPLVRNPSWESVSRFAGEVARPSTVAGYYQPLTMVSLMLDCAAGAGPDHLQPFHRTSLALHVFNTLLLGLLIYLLFGCAWPAATTALIFGVHPIMAESIPWVAERKTVLASFFALSSLVLAVTHARTGRWKAYAASLILFVPAVLSKPTTVPLPLLMLLLDFWPLRRTSRRTLIEKLPFLAVAAIAALIAFVSQSQTSVTIAPGHRSVADTLLVVCHNVVFYLSKIVWPSDLSPCYPFPDPVSLAHPMVLAGVVGTALLGAILLVSLKWTRAMLTGGLVFLLAIFPAIGVVGVHHMVAADRHVYLPIVGVLLVVAAALTGAWTGASATDRPRLWRVATILSVAGLAALHSWSTRRYLAHWRDTPTLYAHMLSVAPHASVVHYGLGHYLQSQGRLDEAIAEYHQSVDFKRDLPIEREWAGAAHNNLAGLLAMRGRIDEALEHYREAWNITPGRPATANNFAWILATTPDPKYRNAGEAVRLAEHACRATGYADPLFLDTLAASYAEAGRFADAVTTARMAVSQFAARGATGAAGAADAAARLKLYESGQPFRQAIDSGP